jgi:putative glutamine amidotransferase
MADTAPSVRIGIYGPDITRGERHGCGLWPAGIAACLTAADAQPVPLTDVGDRSWDELLDGLHGVVLTGHDDPARRPAPEGEALCAWCHNHSFPLLAIDHGLHLLNTSHGGTLYFDLPRDLPEALQHRHPPERGLRHAINVVAGTLLADLYGEGEVVVNSEHRRAVHRVARGFKVGAHALDGVVEALEAESDWFALGVQWCPASATASGLDIQLFRGLIEASVKRWDLAAQKAGAAFSAA